jgi:glycosyltransferase involved in cell wall biosynthesis
LRHPKVDCVAERADAMLASLRLTGPPGPRPALGAAETSDATPLVSIITPSLNQAAFLGATLSSVAMQDYAEIEHIVVDGGSTDTSVRILESFDAPNLRWTSEPDGGQADAIAKGLAMARGDVLTWLNSDDVYLAPDVVSTAVRKMVDTGAQVVTGAGAFIDAEGAVTGPIPLDPDRSSATLRVRDSILQPATFFRRDVAAICPIDRSLRYAFDWDFFIRVSRLAEFEGIDLPLAGYRLHGSGKTETGGWHRQAELWRVCRRYRGSMHPATIGFSAVVACYFAAEHVPARLRDDLLLLASRLVARSNRISNGRGFPY